MPELWAWFGSTLTRVSATQAAKVVMASRCLVKSVLLYGWAVTRSASVPRLYGAAAGDGIECTVSIVLAGVDPGVAG